MSKINYKANKEFLTKIRNCEYTGRDLMNMMETRFKMYSQAGYPQRLIDFTKLVAKMGEDKYGNQLFGCVLSELPIHINTRWSFNSVLAHNDKEMYSSYRFLTYMFPEVEASDYCTVHRMVDDFLRTYNEPLVLAA